MGRIALLAAVLVLAWLVLAFGISLAPGLAGYNRPGWQRVDGGPSDGGAG